MQAYIMFTVVARTKPEHTDILRLVGSVHELSLHKVYDGGSYRILHFKGDAGGAWSCAQAMRKLKDTYAYATSA